ncbi:MAG TPA: NPCBM/NEW2 domain-containing protein [Armatimonadota bacterium]|nr:NPCBM/NEW2 domain-containing protein [Armatimonadota bacterium]
MIIHLPHPRGSRRPALAAVAPALAALLLLAGGSARAEDSTAILADGRTLENVTLKPGPGADQVSLEGSGQPVVTVAAQDLLVLDFGKVPGRPVPPSVRLANGDQVVGKVTFPTARQVKIAAGWGSLTVPLRWCSAIRLDEKAALPSAVTRDTLVLTNDRVEGEIQGVSGGNVTFSLSGKPVPLPLARVQAMALAGRPRSTDTPAGLLLAIDLGGGERLTGRWVKLGPDVLTVRMDWGDTLDVPVASISRLEVKNGKLVYLSDLKPTEARQVPYLDIPFPFQVDRSVSGRPLRLGGKTYRRGLGTHSRCELTYTLDGGYQTLSAMLGIDDAVGGQGSVVYRVFGDEKPLYESPVLRGGDTPVEMKINVKGVLLLRLEVDYADNGDAADHADWADARLLRQ